MSRRLGDLDLTPEQALRGLEYAREHGLPLETSTLRRLAKVVGQGQEVPEKVQGNRVFSTMDVVIEAAKAERPKELTPDQVNSPGDQTPLKDKRVAKDLKPLYKEIRESLKAINTEIGALEKRQIELEGGPENRGVLYSSLDQVRLTRELKQLRTLKAKVEGLGKTATAIRGESSLEQLGLMLQLGAGKGIPYVGWGGGYLLPGFTSRDKVTGKREFFFRTYFQLLLPPLNIGKVPGKKGVTAGLLLGWVSGARDQMLGDVVSGGIPGVGYGGAYSRDGTTGVQAGFYPTLGFAPIDPVLGVAVEHPIAKPLIAPWLGRASQKLDDATRAVKAAATEIWAGFRFAGLKGAANALKFHHRSHYKASVDARIERLRRAVARRLGQETGEPAKPTLPHHPSFFERPET